MKVGIAGLGTIGSAVARALDDGIEGLELAAVCSRDADKAKRTMEGVCRPVPVVIPDELARTCNIVVECAPKEAFSSIAKPVLNAGRLLVTVSAAAILENPEIGELARSGGGKIILATGALLGLDAVRAASEGEIREVRMITRKPPASLEGAPYLAENGVTLKDLSGPLKLFDGSARDGARGFPANVNVAAALGLAGVGPDKTRLEIWADPALDRNTHRIDVDSDSARFSMTIENVPTVENPKTGRITALSVIAALRGIVTPLRAGT